jgi:hypothetical protein
MLGKQYPRCRPIEDKQQLAVGEQEPSDKSEAFIRNQFGIEVPTETHEPTHNYWPTIR